MEIFGKIATDFRFAVPDDLRLRDLNTIAKLADYVAARSGAGASGAAASGLSPDSAAPGKSPGQGYSRRFPGARPYHGFGERVVTGTVPPDQVFAKVKEVIAAQTGYTPDMLEDDLDLEADLGIDTVKQVGRSSVGGVPFRVCRADDLRLQGSEYHCQTDRVCGRSCSGSGAASGSDGSRTPASDQAVGTALSSHDTDSAMPTTAHTMDSGERVVTPAGGDDSTTTVVKR